MKVEVKLRGKKVEVYEPERYDLWKLGLIKVSDDIEKEYQKKRDAENKKVKNVQLGNTQYEVLSSKILQVNDKLNLLEKKIEDHEKLISDLQNSLKKLSNKPKPSQTK